MRQEILNWLEQAKSDLKAAQNSMQSKNFDWACFQAQQAAEKSLKALYIREYQELRKIHDVVLLAKKLACPSEILHACVALSKIYIEARYPDAVQIPAKKFSASEAAECIQNSGVVLQWVTKKL